MKNLEKQPSKPAPSNRNVPNPNPKHADCSFLLYLLTGGLLVMWFSCGNGLRNKGEPCQTNDQCNQKFKCLHHQCGDGALHSPCAKKTDCLFGYRCIDNLCFPSESNREKISEKIPNLKESKEEQPERKEQRNEQKLHRETQTDPKESRSCRKHTDCPKDQLCLLTKDRLLAKCQPSPSPCRTIEDCKKIGMLCRLMPLRDPKKAGTFCIYPLKKAAKYKKAGEICQEQEECQSGICLEKAFCGAFCQTNQDCPKQFYCGTYTYLQRGDFGGCYPKCKTDDDCPTGYECDEQNQCKAQNYGKTGSACRSQKECIAGSCLNDWNHGYCTQPCDDQTSKCEEKDAICALFNKKSGFCLKRCEKNTDCRKDYYCEQEYKGCLPRGNNQLGDRCESNDQCQSGSCHLFPSGHYCSQSCQKTPCPTGYQCNRFLQEKWCEKTCVKNSDCPTGYQCIQQRCSIPTNVSDRRIGEACQTNRECRSQQCLQNTSLYPHGYCTQSCNEQTPCPSGSTCIVQEKYGKICIKSCQTDSSCSRSHYFCYMLQVMDKNDQMIPCSTTNRCPKNATYPTTCHANLQGQFCATGLCLGRGIRMTSQTCSSLFQCRSGFCYAKTGRFGYCAEQCSSDASCPQNTNTICLPIKNKKDQTIGSYCLPTCQSDLQCHETFICRTIQNKKTCQLR